MGYGITVRSGKPRVQVLRGFDPMANGGLTQTAFVAGNVTIKSGQAIVLSWNGTTSAYEWILATNTLANAGATVYIADKDSTDGDVIEGGLMGYSSLGDYEIQTGFYKAGDTYNVDTVLTVDAATPGQLCAIPAGAGTYGVVGKVTRIRGATLLQNAAAGVKDDSSTAAADSGVIVFQTAGGLLTK